MPVMSPSPTRIKAGKKKKVLSKKVGPLRFETRAGANRKVKKRAQKEFDTKILPSIENAKLANALSGVRRRVKERKSYDKMRKK